MADIGLQPCEIGIQMNCWLMAKISLDEQIGI
jgi:hypothetical protein